MSLLQAAALDGAAAIIFLLARALFGIVLAFMGFTHVMDTDAMAAAADAKGVSAPTQRVFFSGGMLLVGGLGVALGAVPVLAAGALAMFFAAATPEMHDFWNAEDTQGEMTHFLKTVALLGVSLGSLRSVAPTGRSCSTSASSRQRRGRYRFSAQPRTQQHQPRTHLQ